MIRLFAAASLLLSLPATAQDEDDPFALLPAGPGQEETFYACASCHSIKLVVQQGMDAEGWDETIEWMIDEQEMEPLPNEERELIVAYLAKFFGTDRPNYPQGR